MKILLTISTLVFTVMFSSTSFAEWTKVLRNEMGSSYVDFERIRKNDGYVYWWELNDFIKRSTVGVLSVERYRQGDCKLFRYMTLSFSYHEERMGGGTGKSYNIPDKEWKYPHPNSSGETILKSVCSR